MLGKEKENKMKRNLKKAIEQKYPSNKKQYQTPSSSANIPSNRSNFDRWSFSLFSSPA